jgi:ribosomal protein S18 acetylase RimI-like enzyme
VNIRRATDADEAIVRELWQEFEVEVPEPPHREASSFEQEWEEIREILAAGGLAILAEDGEGALGLALAKPEGRTVCHLDTVYIRPRGRRQGVAKALMAEVVAWGTARGATHMTLEVLTSNTEARVVYERLGFGEESRILVAPLGALASRLVPGARGPSLGSIHVQTDDQDAVVRAVQQFVPRLPGGSRGSAVAPPRNGWTAVYDELCDREPAMLRRLALELSDRMGAVVLAIGLEEGAVVRYILFERGRVVDEYASLPEYQGPLPPGDVIALGANPTVVHRLTGADPRLVRETARSAASPAELPPATELLARLVSVLGVQGGEHGYGAAPQVPGVVMLERT